jgi:hypothetical protein
MNCRSPFPSRSPCSESSTLATARWRTPRVGAWWPAHRSTAAWNSGPTWSSCPSCWLPTTSRTPGTTAMPATRTRRTTSRFRHRFWLSHRSEEQRARVAQAEHSLQDGQHQLRHRSLRWLPGRLRGRRQHRRGFLASVRGRNRISLARVATEMSPAGDIRKGFACLSGRRSHSLEQVTSAGNWRRWRLGRSWAMSGCSTFPKN